MAIAELAQATAQIGPAVQQLQPVAEQAASFIQNSATALLATGLAVVGCIKVRYNNGGAVELIRGASPKVPEGAKKVASKKPGDNMGTEASGTIQRYHDCNSQKLDANGWPYSTKPTGQPRELPYDYVS